MFAEVNLILSYSFRSKSPFLLDVGAHHGGFAKLFASRGWKVVAFEPEEKNRKAFERNLKEFRNVSCIAKAVFDRSGERAPFFVSEEHKIPAGAVWTVDKPGSTDSRTGDHPGG